MKNRNFVKILFIQLAIMTFATFAFGQTESGTTFANGITVARTTDYGNVNKEQSFSAYGHSYIPTSSSENLIAHQWFINKANKTYTGYDLLVIPQEDNNKFKVLIRPLSVPPAVKDLDMKSFKFLPLPNYPSEIRINDGDIISLSIYENPKTKEKVTDFIIVTRSKSTGPRFASKHIPKDFTIDDVQLRLDGYEIKIDGKSLYKSRGGGSGSNIAIYMPGKGKFIMSPFPREGYPFQKIGTITNNKLTFSYGGENFEILSKSPILGLGGKWHCWIIFQPGYIPNGKDAFSSSSNFSSQSGNIKSIYEN